MYVPPNHDHHTSPLLYNLIFGLREIWDAHLYNWLLWCRVKFEAFIFDTTIRDINVTNEFVYILFVWLGYSLIEEVIVKGLSEVGGYLEIVYLQGITYFEIV